MKKDIRKEKSKQKNSRKLPLSRHLEHINPFAAGIDIGSRSHFVAVPEGYDDVCVREFEAFTTGLYELSSWLKKCGIKTVAMESTSVYWIPLYELLESEGFEVKLVDARHVKNVSGRKTDVSDCQWLQQLHTYGLLNGAFRPDEEICKLRTYLRQRNMLIEQAASHIQHMQKALNQMNVQLHHVISDITGETGMKIIRAIIEGERNPKLLSQYRDPRCKNKQDVIEKALSGHYRDDHVFSLMQSLKLYEFYREKIQECDEAIEKQLGNIESRKEITEEELKNQVEKKRVKNAPSFNLKTHLIRITGVDLTRIPGVEASTALKIISEIGLDMSHWKSEKQFASWLGLSPGNKVSGGKRLSGKTKRTSSRAATALRMAASSLYRSETALGAFMRRLKSRLGAPKAITATAHKIALIMFSMLKKGEEYVETGQSYYEKQYRDRLVKNLNKRAQVLGFKLVEADPSLEDGVGVI